MDEKNHDTGLSRRNFLKTAGAAGLAAGLMPAGVSAQSAAPQAGTMPRRKLGKTGVEVPVLGLGGMFDTVNNQLLLKQAHAWGVTYWDTAEGYGGGLSEEGMGRYFSRNPGARKDIFLVSKFSHKGSGQDNTARLEAGLKRLQTDYLDLFFVHAISSIDDMTPFKDWAKAMKAAGKMKYFGFSTHTNMEDCLLGAAKLDWIDAAMITYNYRLMHTPKMREAMDSCAKAGIGLVAMKTQGGGPVKTDSEAELKLAGRFLEKGFTDKQARLKAVWEEPLIASICSQMPSLTILSANVACARDRASLAREDVDVFTKLAHATKDNYCAGCGAICQGAVDGLVPVNDVMRCLMYYRDYGDRDLAREVFASLPEETRARLLDVDYSTAERACPQGLAIAQLMREASSLLA
ncbi:L-glyceraldehyde 3-phosphate reductase [Fundidesulfovibrio magnetotacticus]|uniref:L-glyceraldehyde 3-phosphate reductase n=1 Tax=Fundidesulfovibrio magnetotacticus TaxID=2730080 RepID=A0A6V8LXK3_9BACT|nr:aldo/keto reductase [Fundidesulfovibrio magnetotacticus]GFK94377.1 L-glyceraldehyde 3-phosphate reductase [Fundidesulfovibrio magnetotacticus]